MTSQIAIDVLLAFIGSIIFLFGSIAYTVDALLKKHPFSRMHIWYFGGSVLFVIGCILFILSSMWHLWFETRAMVAQD